MQIDTMLTLQLRIKVITLYTKSSSVNSCYV